MKRNDSTISGVDQTRWERLPSIRAFAVLVATLIGLYLCYLVTLPFLAALTWALTVAVLAVPLHSRLESRLRRPNLSAAISVTVLTLAVIMPLALLGQQLLGELSTGAAALQKQFPDGDVQRTMEAHPQLGWIVGMIERQIDLKAVFGNLTTWLANLGKAAVQESLAYVITILLTFYLLFYFLRDRRDGLRQLKMLSPLTESETSLVLERASDTIHAMIFGTVITAALQGTLGGVMFWLLGLPNPLFWGLVMALLSIVPILGTFVIWIPAAIYLALSGEWGKAAILTAWGGIVIAGVDNVLYPILAGGRLHLHTVPMFISIVGGIVLFGASGLILGPLAVITTITLLEIWRARADTKSAA